MAIVTIDRPTEGPTRYPWDKWFKQELFTCLWGVDFHGRLDTFLGQVRNRARLEGVKVSIKVVRDGKLLIVRVIR